MARINIGGVQNVQVSEPIPSEKSPREQLEIMGRYTATYQRFSDANKARREVECLKVIFPTLFRHIEDADLIAGRLDFLPIGFGSVTFIGGVGHYLGACLDALRLSRRLSTVRPSSARRRWWALRRSGRASSGSCARICLPCAATPHEPSTRRCSSSGSTRCARAASTMGGWMWCWVLSSSTTSRRAR